jgi:hypothetical protein
MGQLNRPAAADSIQLKMWGEKVAASAVFRHK